MLLKCVNFLVRCEIIVTYLADSLALYQLCHKCFQDIQSPLQNLGFPCLDNQQEEIVSVAILESLAEIYFLYD